MKKIGFILLASLLIPTLYEERKYYVYSKMVKKYENDHLKKKRLFSKLSNYV